MNVFVPISSLPSVAELLDKHEQYLTDRLLNLKMIDVSSEARYHETLAFIKEAVRLQPVTFGAPVFGGSHKKEESNSFQKLGTKLRDVIIRRVSMPFSGSKELFRYTPLNELFPTDAAILSPTDGYLSVDFGVPFFNRRDALNVARDTMRPTMQMIAKNNIIIQNWYANSEARIEDALEKYYREFQELYVTNDLLMVSAKP